MKNDEDIFKIVHRFETVFKIPAALHLDLLQTLFPKEEFGSRCDLYVSSFVMKVPKIAWSMFTFHLKSVDQCRNNSWENIICLR